MKKTIYLLFMLLLIPLITGCSDDDEKIPKEIVGQWKLEKIKTVFGDTQTYDYSQNNIVYEFRLDGKLIVSADIDDALGYDNGIYTYAYDKKDDGLIIIDNDSWWFRITETTMVLDDSPLDGPILYFSRTR